MNGVDFDIFSKRRKSELFGSQYLHQHIPEVTNADDYVNVRYITEGSPVDYRRKAHGKAWDGIIHPDDFQPNHRAWDIRQAYGELWRRYFGKIIPYEIHDQYRFTHVISSVPKRVHPADVATAQLGLSNYNLVVSTVPRTIWGNPDDVFHASGAYALGDAPERGIFVDSSPKEENTIICNGESDTLWYRLSTVHGYTTMEWPLDLPEPPHPQATLVTKPLAYQPASQGRNPTGNWLHVGRYGEWKKGVVVSDAYNAVDARLKEMAK